MEEPVYIDEQGKRIDPSAVGKTHEIVDAASSGQQKKPEIYNRLMQEERVNNFIAQTSPTQSLNTINYMLRGYIYDAAEKEWKEVSEGIPDKIRLDFLQFITPYLSEDVRMTNLSKEQINGIMECVIEWVIDYLDIVADEHNLKEEQMTKIAWIMIGAVFVTLLRAQNGMENLRIFKSLSMGDNLNPQLPGKDQAWKFWKK